MAVFCSPCAWAQDSRDIDQQIDQLEAARQLTDQIEQELRQAAQQVEDEQRALLDRLGRTHDELQDEKHRNRELQQQIDELLGKTPGTAPAEAVEEIAVRSTNGTQYVPRVERRINPLGLVERHRKILTALPPGVNGLSLRLPDASSMATAPLDIKLVQAGNRVTIEQPTPTGRPLELATLSIESGKLVWEWKSFSPSVVRETLPVLDAYLRFAVIESEIDGIAVGQYQFEPYVIRLPDSWADKAFQRPVAIPKGFQAYLDNPTQGSGWALLETTPQAAVWARRDLSLTLGFDGKDLIVTRGPGIASQLNAVKRQRQLWKQDLNQSQTPGYSSADQKRSEDHLQSLVDAETQLTAALESLGDQPGHIQSLAVELIGPQPQMILYRITFEPADRLP
ncbi:MAG: hypothetical protein AAGA25_11315 [Planctomycetota bacterium]